MTRRLAALALLLIPAFAPAFAQTPKSLLWQVSGKDLPSPSYLYGTMHVGDKRAYRFSKSVMPSFNAAEAFAMELDPGKTDALAIMNLMRLDSGKLQDHFTQEEWAKLDGFTRTKLKTPADKFNDYGPFFVYSMVAQVSFKNQKGQPLDLYFYKEAQKSKKEVHGLETAEEQMSAITSMPIADQKNMLLEAIDEEEGEDLMNKMIKYYSKGDLDKLQEMAEDADYGDQFEQALVLSRNHTMVERMIPLLQEQGTFVAVGALHLPGKEGIIELLKAEGYTVSPLK